MERLHIQPERLNPAKPVKAMSFLEVTHKGNRELLKKYMRYGIGVTNLSISVLRTEMIWVRNFLSEAGREDICQATGKQMEEYFLLLRRFLPEIPCQPALVGGIDEPLRNLRVRMA